MNVADNFGRTPLHVAAAVDHDDMVRFLLERGAKMDAQTAGENQTALHYAASNEAVECVKTLLDRGAKIDARDYKQRTPLQVRYPLLDPPVNLTESSSQLSSSSSSLSLPSSHQPNHIVVNIIIITIIVGVIITTTSPPPSPSSSPSLSSSIVIIKPAVLFSFQFVTLIPINQVPAVIHLIAPLYVEL